MMADSAFPNPISFFQFEFSVLQASLICVYDVTERETAIVPHFDWTTETTSSNHISTFQSINELKKFNNQFSSLGIQYKIHI